MELRNWYKYYPNWNECRAKASAGEDTASLYIRKAKGKEASEFALMFSQEESTQKAGAELLAQIYNPSSDIRKMITSNVKSLSGFTNDGEEISDIDVLIDNAPMDLIEEIYLAILGVSDQKNLQTSQKE
jgi:hypothetical protein